MSDTVINDEGKRQMNMLYGHPIYIATQTIQRRKHHKRRINKKWRKKYGCYEVDLIPNDKAVMMPDGTLWMTKRAYEALLSQL